MDPRERQRKEAQLEQGHAFTRLSSHGDWPAFRMWMEKARFDYDELLHNPNERNNGTNMARWAEGYDALNNILRNMDSAMAKTAGLLKELEDEDSGRNAAAYDETTGRKVS